MGQKFPGHLHDCVSEDCQSLRAAAQAGADAFAITGATAKQLLAKPLATCGGRHIIRN